VKRLKRFEKVSLAPGASRTLEFKLGRQDLSFIGADLKPTVEPGTFSALIGGLKAEFSIK
jgi:beta-glucosidase